MINQLRLYTIYDHNRDAFLNRFRDLALPIFEKYGFRILAMWETREEGRPVCVYLLAWNNEAEMAAAWGSFMADEDWKEIKRVTALEHGDMVARIRDHILTPTSFSTAIGA